MSYSIYDLSPEDLKLVLAEPRTASGQAIMDKLIAQDDTDYTPDATAAFEAEQARDDYPEDR